MIPLAIELYVAEVPYCDQAQIEVAPLQGYDGMAGRNRMIVGIHLRGEQLRKTTIHECAHIFWYRSRHQIAKDRIFGHPPYLTDYAKRDKYEDFAVEMTELIMNKRPSTRKQRVIRRLLRSVKPS